MSTKLLICEIGVRYWFSNLCAWTVFRILVNTLLLCCFFSEKHTQDCNCSCGPRVVIFRQKNRTQARARNVAEQSTCRDAILSNRPPATNLCGPRLKNFVVTKFWSQAPPPLFSLLRKHASGCHMYQKTPSSWRFLSCDPTGNRTRA